MKQLKNIFLIKIFLLLINFTLSINVEYPNVLLTLENNPEFLVKAKNSTVQEVKNVLRNISITYEQQVESVKKILNSDKDVKGLYEKIEKLFNKTIDQKLKLIRENFEPLYKNVSANITDPDVKLVAETLASVIRNTSLPLSELELKIKTIFENIEPKVSDQLKVLIPKELNLQINFKSKPWTSKLMDKLRSFGNKIKNFFSGNKNKDDNPTAVNVSNHNSTTKQM
uniref:DUF148 domain-containing protein n=1 Tax=Strongyloides stercoralis TaxID=6248 RepID=A0A0K0EQ52_STRER